MDRLPSRLRPLLVVVLLTLLVAGASQARSGGITGDEAEGGTDVATTGCTCHTANTITPSNSVTLILDGVPYHWASGSVYELKIQLIGGPSMDTSSNTAGFSMRVSGGELSAAAGFESLVQNGDDATTLTHTESGAQTVDRSWTAIWTAPPQESGVVDFWLSGNSVDGNLGAMAPDSWNRMSFALAEGEDNGQTRTVFAGDGNIAAPETHSGELDLHHMGAPFRAHWLGLLGFAAVISVILFCGFFLRFGFSRHYKGRSNLLKLRIKHLRRGDQV